MWSIACASAALFIEQISEVPDGAILIFSAHGVSQAVRNEAKSRDLTVRCHLSAGDQSAYGSRPRQPSWRRVDSDWPCGHPEVEGTMGQYSNPEGECTWWNRRKMSGRWT
jgi:4-hydroxy-3-methylbut-2-enyl diphosphate reductase